MLTSLSPLYGPFVSVQLVRLKGPGEPPQPGILHAKKPMLRPAGSGRCNVPAPESCPTAVDHEDKNFRSSKFFFFGLYPSQKNESHSEAKMRYVKC